MLRAGIKQHPCMKPKTAESKPLPPPGTIVLGLCQVIAGARQSKALRYIGQKLKTGPFLACPPKSLSYGGRGTRTSTTTKAGHLLSVFCPIRSQSAIPNPESPIVFLCLLTLGPGERLNSCLRMSNNKPNICYFAKFYFGLYIRHLSSMKCRGVQLSS